MQTKQTLITDFFPKKEEIQQLKVYGYNFITES
jgi:hypothetical protein